MQNPLICVFGRSGSGKTAIALELGKNLNVPVIHAGKFFEQLARSNGVNHLSELVASKEQLISGINLLLLKEIKKLKYVGRPIIIEGISSIETLKMVANQVSSSEIILVNVHAHQSIRFTRLMKRHSIDREEAAKKILRSDRLKSKLGLRTLEKAAKKSGVVIDNSRPLERIVKDLVTKFHRR